MFSIFLCFGLSQQIASQSSWAVLVAGSNTFSNYRHQADVSHSYQVLKEKGFNMDNVIVMMYDDIANNTANPFPGKIFNQNSSGVGKDVYSGVKIDYWSEDVSPTNFLAVLTGTKANVTGTNNNGRVLNSTSNDDVFIFFSDHGGPQIIAFQDNYLYADDLLAAFDTMKTKKMYKQLTFYLEACESGSMFQTLPANVSIYAVSASSPSESSWGTYCPPQDMVNGTELQTCLGDLFSINWMQDADKNNAMKETLEVQYTHVKTATTQSSVMQWGELTFVKEDVADFYGNMTSLSDISEFAFTYSPQHLKTLPKGSKKANTGDWNQRLNDVNYYHNIYMKDPTNIAKKERYISELNKNQWYTDLFAKLANKTGLMPAFDYVLPNPVHIDFVCYKHLANIFIKNCGKLNAFGTQYMRIFAHMCDPHYEEQLEHSASILANDPFAIKKFIVSSVQNMCV